MNSTSSSTESSVPAAGRLAAVPFGWRAAAGTSVWLLLVYLAIVLPLDSVMPALNRLSVALVLLVASVAVVRVGLRWLVGRTANPEETTKSITISVVMILFCLLATDIGFTAYTNSHKQFRVDTTQIFESRWQDERIWDGEIMPELYTSAVGNFQLYKPDQAKSGATYGEHYYPELMRHPLLRDQVLQQHRIEFTIDRYGLRNTHSPAESTVFALGDSFCFGYHTTQADLFTERLGARIGSPIYNMGVSGTSPMQQFQLFEHHLRTWPDVFKPRQLVWLIFEGNDLEESYAEKAPSVKKEQGLTQTFDGTLVGMVASIPSVVRQQSLLRLALGRDVSLSATRNTAQNHYELDGETIAYPLFRSKQFGPRLFRQQYLDRAVQPESYVTQHPNAPRLAAVFERMKALAAAHGISVTIVTVPSDVRLYKDAFEDMPPVSPEPYFLNYVKKLAAGNGFGIVDLYELLKPQASTELLYYRDDTHWTPRGHQLVADLLAEHLAPNPAGSAAPNVTRVSKAP
jgi:hypothetical protein